MRVSWSRRQFVLATAVLAVALTLLLPAVVFAAPEGSSSPGDGTHRATIRRTPDGVPHVVADNWADLAFGQGYASAQDRSCDLADQVVKIKGERSRWFGAGPADANLNSDVGWRAIGLYDRARADYPRKSTEVLETFDGFAAGWNLYLRQVGAGGLNGWCRGAPWVQPVTGMDVYAYARSISIYASSAQMVNEIATAQPPGRAVTTAPAAAPVAANAAYLGSNGWALGKDRTASGAGLLLANPHFPWERELRFWEVELTIPGRADIYGAQLSGLPGIGIGFTDQFAWTHTVSAGNRFTGYTLDLVPGKPTSYYYDGRERPMTSRQVSVEVKRSDGSLRVEKRTLWSTHYGPVVNAPFIGWTTLMTGTVRDANLDNDAFADQVIAMNRARTFDDLVAADRRFKANPLYNTVATSKDGRTWYADTAATPNLSRAALDIYRLARVLDPLTVLAASLHIVILNGSASVNEWVNAPGARSPGLVPYDKLPQTQRTDYVFNANDSFWLPNADHPIEGDYSPLHGEQRTARSLRTRQNAVVLRDTSPTGPAGADRKMSLDELTTAALDNRSYSGGALRDELVARCRATPRVDVPVDLLGGPTALPPGTVDLRAACAVLAAWDGTFDLGSKGAALWRETMVAYDEADTTAAGRLFATGFDPARPVDTPAGLAPAPLLGPDQALVALGRAVQLFARAKRPLDSTMGDLQYADRNGTRVPVHGGDGFIDGTTNTVYNSTTELGTTLEKVPGAGEYLAPRSSLTKQGYFVNYGSSFVMAVDLGGPAAVAKVLSASGNTQDRTDPRFVATTQEFAAKRWRTIRLGESVTGQPGTTEVTVQR